MMMLIIGITILPAAAANAQICPAYPVRSIAGCPAQPADNPTVQGLLQDDTYTQNNDRDTQDQITHLQGEITTQWILLGVVTIVLVSVSVAFIVVTRQSERETVHSGE